MLTVTVDVVHACICLLGSMLLFISKLDHIVMKMLNLKTVRVVVVVVVEVWMPPLKEGAGTLVTHHLSQVLNQMIVLIQTKTDYCCFG